MSCQVVPKRSGAPGCNPHRKRTTPRTKRNLQVIGDTWQAWPELQLKALKRMYTYASQEKATDKQAPAQPATPTSGRLGKKLSRSFSSSSAQTTGSWQSTFDDLAKSPGARLLPLIKVPFVA